VKKYYFFFILFVLFVSLCPCGEFFPLCVISIRNSDAPAYVVGEYDRIDRQPEKRNIKMRMKTILLALLLTHVVIASYTQEMPHVYDVENTGADCPEPPLPPFNRLPMVKSLPDPFEWTDGSGRITSRADWRCRRAEIGAEIQYYGIGRKPPPPDTLEAYFSDDTLRITIIVGGETLTLNSAVTIPDGEGPFPAVIGVGITGGTGSLPADIFTGRGIATIQYNFREIAPWGFDVQRGTAGFYTIYPDSGVGFFAAWAWGVSRVIDGLEEIPNLRIDLSKLAVTGCSFAGKIALFSGAFDERITLTIAQEPGGGGAAAWLVTETLDGKRETPITNGWLRSRAMSDVRQRTKYGKRWE
jgi:hypothetical protein